MYHSIVRATASLVFVCFAAAAGFGQQAAPSRSSPHLLSSTQTRTFTFTYAFTVENPRQGKKLRVWFPLPPTDQYQSVHIASATGDLPLKQTEEKQYGNRMFYAETEAAEKTEYHFEVVYEITRYERAGLQEAESGKGAQITDAALHPYLEPNRLVPVTGTAADIAAKQTAGKATELDQARAIYDYVFANMKYDKTGTGWGHGDTEWACTSKRGNCTDFHSLFASMARSQGIPTRFSIGFPLPADKHTAEIPAYHCWADFYLNDKHGRGWVPVDISEAWKHPENKDYFFGTLDVNRVQFSTGRDLTLAPQQDGPPVNYFVYAYVESDGKEFPNVKNAFSFADAGAQAEQASSH
jgi:transglutaminase-like putative cysteine protease